MATAEGDVCKIYMDSWDPIKPGDYVVTAATQRTYHVQEVRVQARGIHRGRQHLLVRVAPKDEPTAEDKVHTLHWYARGRSSG